MDLLREGLERIGLGVEDIDDIDALLAERILAVPGRGFGLPGYFRLAFCVSEKIIANSADSFKRAMDKVTEK